MNKKTYIWFSGWLMTILIMLVVLTVPLLAKKSGGLETESGMSSRGQQIAGSSERIIDFAGRQWGVKSGCGLGPGPNCWSDSEQSVWHRQSRKQPGQKRGVVAVSVY